MLNTKSSSEFNGSNVEYLAGSIGDHIGSLVTLTDTLWAEGSNNAKTIILLHEIGHKLGGSITPRYPRDRFSSKASLNSTGSYPAEVTAWNIGKEIANKLKLTDDASFLNKYERLRDVALTGYINLRRLVKIIITNKNALIPEEKKHQPPMIRHENMEYQDRYDEEHKKH
jgi:hypothetical protein